MTGFGRRTLSVVTASGLLTCVSLPTSAQRIESPYRFVEATQGAGAFAGYISTGKGSIGLGPESGPVFGGRYGIRVSGPFMFEAEVGFFPSPRAVLDTVPGDTTFRQVGDADMRLVLALGALRLNITGPRTWHGLQPFGLFGGGGAIDVSGESAAEAALPEDVRFDFGTSFAGMLGVGIEWFLTPGTAIRIDARSLLWKLPTPPAFRVGNVNVSEDEWAQNFFVSAGFSIHF